MKRKSRIVHSCSSILWSASCSISSGRWRESIYACIASCSSAVPFTVAVEDAVLTPAVVACCYTYLIQLESTTMFTKEEQVDTRYFLFVEGSML